MAATKLAAHARQLNLLGEAEVPEVALAPHVSNSLPHRLNLLYDFLGFVQFRFAASA